MADVTPSPRCDGQKELRICLYRFDSFGGASSQANTANDKSNKRNSLDSTSPPRQRYRRRNCDACKGCARDDCLDCSVCLGAAAAKRKRKCLRRICRRPLLPKNAKCAICWLKILTPSIDVARFPKTHSDLAECGLCGKVVHPACLIRRYNMAADAYCVFYHELLNAWDCVLCNLGVKEIKEATAASIPSSSSSFSSALTSSSSVCAAPSSTTSSSSSSYVDNLRTRTKNDATDGVIPDASTRSSESRPPSCCELCAKNDLTDYLMTCTRCGGTQHDVCAYVRHRSDPRFAELSGVRNCFNSKLWECPSCLWRRGVRDDNWVKTGIPLKDPVGTTRTIEEKTIDMFSPQTGNVVVSHFAIREENAAGGGGGGGGGGGFSPPPPPSLLPQFVSSVPDEVECFMDVLDPELMATTDEETAAVAVGEGRKGVEVDEATAEEKESTVVNFSVLNLLPMAAIKCHVCSSLFSSEEALRSHVTSQHPMCGHCSPDLRFQDIPKILSHFKAEHKNLKRCKVLIANETLIIAMNSSFNG